MSDNNFSCNLRALREDRGLLQYELADADYKANALAKAETYYTMMSMSKDRIYDQLTSEYGEQFTAEEAQYAIDHLDD